MLGDCAVFARLKIAVPGFGAEMRQVHAGHRIGRAHAQDRAGRHYEKAFPRAQDGQGAEKPLTIHHVIPIGHAKASSRAGRAGQGGGQGFNRATAM